MAVSKHGEVVYIENGVLTTWLGKIIEKPSLCIDEDVLISWGDYDLVKSKSETFINTYNILNVDSSIKVLPLYEKLSVEDCYFVIEIAFTYTSIGFLKKLGEVFNTDELHTWLEYEKECKKV